VDPTFRLRLSGQLAVDGQGNVFTIGQVPDLPAMVGDAGPSAIVLGDARVKPCGNAFPYHLSKISSSGPTLSSWFLGGSPELVAVGEGPDPMVVARGSGTIAQGLTVPTYTRYTVLSLGAGGSVRWAQTLANVADAGGFWSGGPMVVDRSGAAVFAGTFSGTIDFQKRPADGLALQWGEFVMKFGPGP
jgi:hypothetical protein